MALMASHQPIFKLILAAYFFLGIVAYDVINMNGKVLRIIVFQVNLFHHNIPIIFKKLCAMFYLKFPPTMIITREADGTVRYTGIAFEMLDYISKALKIR